jgi:hypothetical protein
MRALLQCKIAAFDALFWLKEQGENENAAPKGGVPTRIGKET